MPFVANPRKAATDLVGKLLAELARPLSDGFVANDDAARRQQLLHHAQGSFDPDHDAVMRIGGEAPGGGPILSVGLKCQVRIRPEGSGG
jgi:hypothetical protein